MTIKHFELAAADNQLNFSPYCWRTRMALLHKSLPFATTPWLFSDKSATEPSGSDKTPVIFDSGTWVHDSWEIVKYLDKTYPDSLAILPNDESVSLAKLVESLCNTYLFPAIVPVVLTQVHKILSSDCQAYFRQTREAFFDTELENINIDAETGKANIATALSYFEALLEEQTFICGDSSGYADYILYGILKWADVVSEYDVLDRQSVVGTWFTRVDALFNEHGKNAKTVRS